MRASDIRNLGFMASLVVTGIGWGVSMFQSTGGERPEEGQYMSSDNPWSLASGADDRAGATESSVYYSGCDAARAAGAAPIYRGQPGYREGMDGDNDGIACEPYRGS